MDLDTLKQKARTTINNAYVRYSNFPVACAYLDKNGQVYTGVNVENMSYGLTVCAERNAIFSAVTQGSQTIDTLVIYTPTASPTMPCGACRQVIKEFSSSARIVSICDGDEVVDVTIEDLLPGSFQLP